MKLLLDMNLSPRWVGSLEAAGFHAEHWSTVGRTDAADREVMQHARDNDLVVLTHDLDFTTILALTNWAKPSVVQIRVTDTSPEAIATILIKALRQTADELQRGAVLTVEPTRSRMRVLPFR